MLTVHHLNNSRSQRIQQSFILKGITMTGAALLITQLGVGVTRGE